MRILHGVFAVFLTALMLTVCREPAGRVAVVVFLGATLVVAVATAAILLLFKTLGSIGEARDLLELAQCLLATGVVLGVAALLMLGTLAACLATVRVLV